MLVFGRASKHFPPQKGESQKIHLVDPKLDVQFAIPETKREFTTENQWVEDEMSFCWGYAHLQGQAIGTSR